MFGFHLCALEWRQHRDRVVRALDEIVALVEPALPPLSERTEAERAAWFARELVTPRPLIPRRAELSAEGADIVASLEAVATLRAQRGAGTVASLILAGTEAPFDILALFALSRACGAHCAGALQLVPLPRATPRSQTRRNSHAPFCGRRDFARTSPPAAISGS